MRDEEILREMPRLRALIVGDVCLDRWCTYDPALSEPSVETGIPRVAVVSTDTTPGAGGTIANNLIALGAGRVTVLGIVGDDGHAYELLRALQERGIVDALIASHAHQTFTYTKLLNAQTGAEDRPRIDFLHIGSIDAAAERALLDRLPELVDQHDVILVSDQAETDSGGVVTACVRALLADLAPAYREKVFLADSRRRAHLFRNLMLKPNEQEAADASLKALGKIDFAALCELTCAPALFVTQGGEGVRVYEPGNVEMWVQTWKVKHPVDVCGAGDSFAAGAAAALFLSGSKTRAAEFGNRVARVTISKPGTGTASPEEVLREPHP